MRQREVVEGQRHRHLPALFVPDGAIALLALAPRLVVSVPVVSGWTLELVAPVASASVQAHLVLTPADVTLAFVNVLASPLVTVEGVAFGTGARIGSRFVDAGADAQAAPTFPHLTLIHVHARPLVLGETKSFPAYALVRTPGVDARMIT